MNERRDKTNLVPMEGMPPPFPPRLFIPDDAKVSKFEVHVDATMRVRSGGDGYGFDMPDTKMETP